MDTESFSKSKAMELPRNVVVGHDALHTVGEVCQSLKLGKRALIVADETTMKIAGMTVEKELAARKIRCSEFLIPDATMKEVQIGRASCRERGVVREDTGRAKDGIRDDLVTGVQTCALPICRP